jgi:phage terminase large subunit-like protein
MQRQRIAAACQRYNVSALIAEANAMGKPNNDELRKMGVRARDFTTTNATKADAIESLAAAFEQARIAIPNDDKLVMELEAFEAERMASGGVRYAAPDGMHDDMVMSLALAWSAVSNRVDPVAYGWQR